MTSCLTFSYSVPMHVMRKYNAKPQRICIFFKLIYSYQKTKWMKIKAYKLKFLYFINEAISILHAPRSFFYEEIKIWSTCFLIDEIIMKLLKEEKKTNKHGKLNWHNSGKVIKKCAVLFYIRFFLFAFLLFNKKVKIFVQFSIFCFKRLLIK